MLFYALNMQFKFWFRKQRYLTAALLAGGWRESMVLAERFGECGKGGISVFFANFLYRYLCVRHKLARGKRQPPFTYVFRKGTAYKKSKNAPEFVDG